MGEEKKKPSFVDFIKEHPGLAFTVALAAGGAGAYLGETNGFSLQASAVIGMGTATAATLLASLAYLERPDYVRDHPVIAGLQFLGASGVTAYFIEEYTGGIVSMPIVTLLAACGGVAAVGITAAGYEWLAGFLSWNPVKTAADKIGEGVSVVTHDMSDGIKYWLGQETSQLDLDKIEKNFKKNGTPEQQALIAEIKDLFWKDAVNQLTDEQKARLELLVGQLRVSLDETGRNNNGEIIDKKKNLFPPTNRDADAQFTTNADNPPPPPPPAAEPEGEHIFTGTVDLDKIKKSGTADQKALAARLSTLMLRIVAGIATDDEEKEYADKMLQLRRSLAV